MFKKGFNRATKVEKPNLTAVAFLVCDSIIHQLAINYGQILLKYCESMYDGLRDNFSLTLYELIGYQLLIVVSSFRV